MGKDNGDQLVAALSRLGRMRRFRFFFKSHTEDFHIYIY